MQTIQEQLEELAEEACCHECRAVLTEEELEKGYVCDECVREWMHQVVPEY